MHRIGELAALVTAMSWAIAALFFERGIKHIGVLTINFFKVVIALVLITITAAVMRGMPLPLDVSPNSLLFLSLSGFVGFVITDMFLFSAYNTVGPRVAMLFMALSPLATAGIAYLFLGESMGSKGFLGMGLVIAGILMTIVGKQGSFEISTIAKEDRKGYIYAFIAPIGQAMGIVLSKMGLVDYNPVSGTQIRLFTAVLGFGLVSLIFYRGQNVKKALQSREGMKFTFLGSIFGPFLSVTLALYAVQHIHAGIASSIIGITPILILIPEILIFKKKVKALEIIGALIAVCGTALFFLL